jgi:uncharacterized protein YdeI (YjbR/CyaY-like superfamily)
VTTPVPRLVLYLDRRIWRHLLFIHPVVLREFFATLDSRNRYAILYRIQTVGNPETRAQRIEKFIAMLTEHEKIYS